MDIDTYTARTPQLISTDNLWVRAFVGDDIPESGHALEIRSPAGEVVYAVVRSHAGARQVDAMLLDRPQWLADGLEVFTTGLAAHVHAPTEQTTHLDDLAMSAGPAEGTIALRLRAPEFSELDGQRTPIETTYSGLDRLSPLCAGGLNLVLDASAEPAAFDALVVRAHAAVAPDESLWLAGDGRRVEWASHQIEASSAAQAQLTGLRVLMSWAGARRDAGGDVFLCAELPPLSDDGFSGEVDQALGVSIGEVVDQIGSALSSTKTAAITTVVRLPLSASAAGIEHIIETMDVGDVDAQVFIDEAGRFDPHRSTSDADLGEAGRGEKKRLLSMLSRAERAREKSTLLGINDLGPAERKALDEADSLAERLV